MTHEGQGRRPREKVAAPDRRPREDVEEGAHDDGELGLRELVERQPLAEEPVGGQSAPHGAEVLAGVEGRFSGPPRHEKIAHHDVEASRRSGQQVVASVVGHDLHPRVRHYAGVQLGEGVARRAHHVGDDLQGHDAGHGMGESGACRDSGSQPHERDAAGRGMQEQRKVPLPPLLLGCRGAAQDVGVVDGDPSVVGVFENRRRPVAVFVHRSQPLSRADAHGWDRGRSRDEKHRPDHGADGPPLGERKPDAAPEKRRQDADERHALPQAKRWSDEKGDEERAEDGASRVDGEKAADVEARGLSLAPRHLHEQRKGRAERRTSGKQGRAREEQQPPRGSEPALRGQVLQPAGQMAEESGGDDDEHPGGGPGPPEQAPRLTTTAEGDASESGAAREPEQEDHEHDGERIDGVLVNEGEHPHPEDLQGEGAEARPGREGQHYGLDTHLAARGRRFGPAEGAADRHGHEAYRQTASPRPRARTHAPPGRVGARRARRALRGQPRGR